jgi:hypothetical protein
MATTAKGKAPSKTCGKCGKANHARSAKCKFCEEPFPVKAKPEGAKPQKKAAKPAPPTAPPTDTLTAAIGLVKAAGGFDRAKAILAELEQVRGL